MDFKLVLSKFRRLLTISLSLAIILTVLPIHTVRVHAAETVTVTANCTSYANAHTKGGCRFRDGSQYGSSYYEAYGINVNITTKKETSTSPSSISDISFSISN